MVIEWPVVILDPVTLMQLDQVLLQVHFVLFYPTKQPLQSQRRHQRHKSVLNLKKKKNEWLIQNVILEMELPKVLNRTVNKD